MTSLFFGIDVSKGYADVCCINQAGSYIGNPSKFDDTRSGHNGLKSLVESLRVKHPDAQIVFGLENSGGLERTWAVSIKEMILPFSGKIFTLNPLAVKKFLDRDLHRTITDKVSAQGIANYLRHGMCLSKPGFEDALAGPISLYRCLRNAIYRCAKIQNELQSILPRVQPEMVQFCRDGFPNWVLTVLQSWSTAPKLAKAKISQLCKIPYLMEKRAESLISAAKESIASQTDSFTETTIAFLASEIVQAQKTIAALKKKILESLNDDQGFKMLTSIPGIGAWGAVCLRLEIGDIERFPSPEALVAFAGIDPRVRQSGDSLKNIGISRRGRREIRAILFPLTLSAIHCNPTIKAFYARLRSKGKGHLVSTTACMRKMLHIIYGCWLSQKPFNANHEKTRKIADDLTEPKQEAISKEKVYYLRIEAPVSRREANKRRKATTMSQTAGSRQARDPVVASKVHSK